MHIMRSRFLFHKEKKIFVIVNYKCGYTCLNKLPELVRVKNIDYIVANSNNNKVILMYRDPIKRFLSFVHNWFFDKDDNVHLKNLRKCINKKNYKRFFELKNESETYNKALTLLFSTGKLTEFIKLNEHTHPQHLIFNEYKDTIRIDEAIDLDNSADMDKLKKILGTSIEYFNKSSRSDEDYLDDEIKDAIKKLYYDDFEFIRELKNKKLK